MPKGPQGQKRPADAIGNAVHVIRMATGRLGRAGMKALAIPHQELRCSKCPLLAQSGHGAGRGRTTAFDPKRTFLTASRPPIGR
jgi:hypothetical protein